MFNVEHLTQLRTHEMGVIASQLPPQARVLELGAGAGAQSLELIKRGFDVVALDVPDSNYKQQRLMPITEYDGQTFPFPDGSFDVVFSSNVLEHIANLSQIYSEIRRVLRPDGYAVHVLPTHVWRFWTTLSAFPSALQYTYELRKRLKLRFPTKEAEWKHDAGTAFAVLRHMSAPIRQRRHGERGNLISEYWYFRPEWWRKNFAANAFEIMHEQPMGLFYTGHMVSSLTLEQRARLAQRLGSACHLFKVRPTSPA